MSILKTWNQLIKERNNSTVVLKTQESLELGACLNQLAKNSCLIVIYICDVA